MEITSHNKKNKKEVAKTIVTIYNSSEYIRKMLLNRLLWAATENDDEGNYIKYIGQPYWSAEAIEQYKKNIKNKEKDKYKDLRHEHSVPKKEKINAIEKLKHINEKDVLN